MRMPEAFRTTLDIELKSIGVITNGQSNKAARFAENLKQWLTSAGITHSDEVKQAHDIIITLGGDGTLLRIAEKASHHGIPVLGINLGNLGFLTELTEEETFTALEKLMEGKISVENRMMLKTHVEGASTKENKSHRYALNDVVINKNTLDRLLSLSVRANDQRITTYKADGLIFSSSTGSTAYSLSAGGPLVHPGLASILVTPICPFMLSSRPLLLPDTTRITTTFSPECNIERAKIIIDGQEAWDMSQGDTLIIEKAEHPLQLISTSSRNYYQVLRNKLLWGSKENR